MNGKMKNSKMWYIIIALCTIDLILLYTNKAKDDVIQNNMNEIAILKNNDNNSISAYFKSQELDLLIRSESFHAGLDSAFNILHTNDKNSLYLLVMIPKNACWSCIEEELINVVNCGYNIIFMCPEYLKNAIKMIDNGKCQVISIPPLILNAENFEFLTYVKINNRQIFNVYIPIYGTQLHYIQKFMK